MARAQREAVDNPFNRFGEVAKNMNDIQIEFPRDKARAQIGQKVDATAATVVSATSHETIPFGALVVYDDTDAFLCKLPTVKAHLEKPLGITLRQLHCDDYLPKSSIAVMRKGRVWVEADKVASPGDLVGLKFLEDGSVRFTGDIKDTLPLKGAIFLERSDGGLAPIEVNFFGGIK
jgi:hypothetical protein